MKQPNTFTLGWLCDYVRGVAILGTATFGLGLLLAIIPVLVLAWTYGSPTTGIWVIAAISIAILGGLTQYQASRSKTCLDRKLSDLSVRIELMEYWHKDETRKLVEQLKEFQTNRPVGMSTEDYETKWQLLRFIKVMKDAQIYGFEPVQEEMDVTEENE
jgi:hypothetical protein